MINKVWSFKQYSFITIFQNSVWFTDYYRVTYDNENYRLIAEQLLTDHTVIRDNNRAQLLDDAFVVASAHMLPYKQALDLTDYLKKETEYVPWNAVLAEFNYIDSMLYDQSQYADWKVCLNFIVNSVFFT